MPEEILYLHLYKGRPFALATTEGVYDVEVNKAGCVYIAMTGGGYIPEPYYDGARYWAAPGIRVKTTAKYLAKRIKALPEGWSENLEECDVCPVDHTIYCEVCKDWIGFESLSHTCDHIDWFPLSTAWFGGSGCPDDLDGHREAVWAFLDAISAVPRRCYAKNVWWLLETLSAERWIIYPFSYDYKFHLALSVSRVALAGEGFLWLRTLVPGETTEAIEQTIEWIESWLKIRYSHLQRDWRYPRPKG